MSHTVHVQLDLPTDIVKSLEQRGRLTGSTLVQQILEAIVAYLGDSEDPILRASDPLFKIAGGAASNLGDLSTRHDVYLYTKDWQRHSQEATP